MQTKDWLAIIAFVISLASLCLSFYNFRFNSLIKIIEIRSTLLAKCIELTYQIDRVDRLFQSFVPSAIIISENNITSLAEKTEKIRTGVKNLHDALTSLPLRRTIKAYQISFDAMHRHSELLLDYEQQLKYLQHKYEQNKPPSSKLQAAPNEA